MTASDQDGNSQVTFLMNSTDDFTINSRGIIMTAQNIDGDLYYHRNTTVTACDDSGLCSHVPLSVSWIFLMFLMFMSSTTL